MERNLSAMQEIWVPSMDQDDPLEKGMATHSSILAWEIPWAENPGSTVHGITESDTNESLSKYEV